MLRFAICLSLVACLGCSGGNPNPNPPSAPKTVNTTVLKELLTGIAASGFAGSGVQQLQIGVDATSNEELKKDMAELAKADLAGQAETVKQLAAKMLKSL